MTRRKQRGSPVISTFTLVDGKKYRVAHTEGRILLIAVRYPAARERLLDPDGRRFRRVARHFQRVMDDPSIEFTKPGLFGNRCTDGLI